MTETPFTASANKEPDESAHRFARYLRRLLSLIGNPTPRELSERTFGEISPSEIASMLNPDQTRLPPRATLEALIDACEEIADRYLDRVRAEMRRSKLIDPRSYGPDDFPDILNRIDQLRDLLTAESVSSPTSPSSSGQQPTATSAEIHVFRRRNDQATDAAPRVPVTIYLSEDSAHEQVEAAVAELLGTAGLDITDRDEPVIGSWFRQMRAALRSPSAQKAALVAVHVADSRLLLPQDAAFTATMLQNLGPVITALQPTKDAVLRVGALLIVKIDWALEVYQLTADQQAKLDHHPQLGRAPHEIVAALDLTDPTHGEDRALDME